MIADGNELVLSARQFVFEDIFPPVVNVNNGPGVLRRQSVQRIVLAKSVDDVHQIIAD